jgi:hypothetical protein
VLILLTNNLLMVQAPGFIRGINSKSKIKNPQALEFIRGINPKLRSIVRARAATSKI